MSLFDAIHKHDVEESERLAKLKVDYIEEDDITISGKNYYLQPLGLALFYGYDDIVILLRNYGYNLIGTIDIDYFVKKGLIAIVRFYFKYFNENPNQINKEGLSLLEIAIGNNDEKMVELLLEKSANPNFVTSMGKSLLHIAVDEGQQNIVKILLSRGANPNTTDLTNDQTPLHMEISKDEPNPAIIKLLLDYGAQPTSSAFNPLNKDIARFNPFHIAIKRQKHEIVDLMAHSISSHKDRNYLLVFAAREFDESSLLYRDYLPPDMFKLIFSQAWERFHRMFGRRYLKN